MSASEYVRTYLQLQVWKNDVTTTPISVRNYLQSGLGTQSTRAASAYAQLIGALPKQAGLPPGRALPGTFQVRGDQYVTTSLWRVYNGKGTPTEIQEALWLALLCSLVDEKTLTPYVDNNLGIDCGGFVANYWGMGRPSVSAPSPTGATGFKPRTIWGMFPKLQRKNASEIEEDDAAVFFKDVKNDDPNIAAQPKAGGGYNSATGSQAFHIGVVSAVTAIAGTNQVDLDIAESSGAKASSGGNGVNVRSLGKVTATVAKGLVYCPDGNNRIYFTGKQGPVTPYPPTVLYS
jgi:hypothetical protein